MSVMKRLVYILRDINVLVFADLNAKKFQGGLQSILILELELGWSGFPYLALKVYF